MKTEGEGKRESGDGDNSRLPCRRMMNCLGGRTNRTDYGKEAGE